MTKELRTGEIEEKERRRGARARCSAAEEGAQTCQSSRMSSWWWRSIRSLVPTCDASRSAGFPVPTKLRWSPARSQCTSPVCKSRTASAHELRLRGGAGQELGLRGGWRRNRGSRRVRIQIWISSGDGHHRVVVRDKLVEILEALAE